MRHYENWLEAFGEYCESSEAPRHVLFWVGVSAIAGALQKKVWMRMGKFNWAPNMYVVLVGEPGVIGKSTTSSYAKKLLEQVPGVYFGPSVITWQALVLDFTDPECIQDFIAGDQAMTQAAMTLYSSELGTLVSPGNREMLDILTDLYDGISFKKKTMKDGKKGINNPCLNFIACTTPEWISTNLPAYMIGSGFVSRCVMVLAEEKAKLVAYPQFAPTAAHEAAMEPLLVEDLIEISEMTGEMTLSPQAKEWGEWWYNDHHTYGMARFGDVRGLGYHARKQAHGHKLAMCLSAARGGDKEISLKDLQSAMRFLDAMERKLPQVYDLMGKSQASTQSDRIYAYIKANPHSELADVQKHVHNSLPREADFNAVFTGLLHTGLVKYVMHNSRRVLVTGTLAAEGDSPTHVHK